MDESTNRKSAVLRNATRQRQNADRNKKTLMRMSATACDLILVRHGETHWNVEHRLQGHSDPQPALTSVGSQQAEKLSEQFTKCEFDAVYCSDLSRAIDTATILCRSIPKPTEITTLFGLRERRLGILEGFTMKEARSLYPDLVAKLATSNSDFPPDSKIESQNEFSHRVLGTISDIASRHPNGKVLVVTHGGVLRTISQAAGQWTRFSSVENCSVYMLRIDCSCKPPLLALTSPNEVTGQLDANPSGNEFYA